MVILLKFPNDHKWLTGSERGNPSSESGLSSSYRYTWHISLKRNSSPLYLIAKLKSTAVLKVIVWYLKFARESTLFFYLLMVPIYFRIFVYKYFLQQLLEHHCFNWTEIYIHSHWTKIECPLLIMDCMHDCSDLMAIFASVKVKASGSCTKT